MAPDGGEVDKGPVVVHRLLDVLESVREHPVEFAGENRCVARDDALALSEEVSEAHADRRAAKDEPCAETPGRACREPVGRQKTRR